MMSRIARYARRLAWYPLRAVSPEYRAYSDLFVPPFCHWADWHSGLVDCDLTLYSLARALRPKVVAEIGSARGKSTCIFALACRQNGAGHVYAIDPHTFNAWTDLGAPDDTYTFLRRRLHSYGFEDVCTVIRSTSADAARGWDRPIDLLFIDGDHTYEGVRHDFEAFQPFLTERALVLFHDSAWEHARDNRYYRDDIGVPQFLQELQAAGYPSIT